MTNQISLTIDFVSLWTTTVRCRAARHRTVCTMWPDISSISFIVRCRAIGQRDSKFAILTRLKIGGGWVKRSDFENCRTKDGNFYVWVFGEIGLKGEGCLEVYLYRNFWCHPLNKPWLEKDLSFVCVAKNSFIITALSCCRRTEIASSKALQHFG